MNAEDLKPLTNEDIDLKLKDVPGWEFKDEKLSKEFTFNDFDEAIAFITKLAPFCTNLDHHPDVHIYYSKVVFELQRFDIGGKVTERDFTVAKEIERLYTERKQAQ